ncbi:TraX family protein [Oxalobacteraceae bacterium R-40]|uniref:TraX family protein n=1 Tax=Keguizhuia sedimenti TaxID=3064264 RepID=A0ABU1BKD7_9BURK|nr:TraX family protein [Oxalobacteraceae bacterium R-40]
MPQPNSHFSPQLRLSDGMIEALKFLALVLMVLDHTNRFVLGGSMPSFSYVGRLAFPLFAAILGWNLARPSLSESGADRRMLKRLFLFGLAASIPYVGLLGYQWWQLNILFTLWAGAAIVLLIKSRQPAAMLLAAVLFALSGTMVDYAWYGVAVCIASWAYSRQPTWISFLAWIACIASLVVINHNFAALFAVPLLLFASGKEVRFPRYRNFFYWFYPLHLVLLGFLAQA